MEFTEKEVIPIIATGKIEGDVESMVGLEVRLEQYTLAWDAAPGTGSSYKKLFDTVRTRNPHFNEEEAKAYISGLRKLWGYVKRAGAAEDEKVAKNAALAEAKARMQKAITVSAVEAFGLNGNQGNPTPGNTLVGYDGTFYAEGKPVSNLFFSLVVKNDGEKGQTVAVVDIPEHLKGVLGDLVKQPFPMTENFRDVPAPLRQMLRAIKGQTEKALHAAKA